MTGTFAAAAVYLAIVVLNVADGWLTAANSRFPGVREANPVQRWMMRQLGVGAGLIVTKGVALIFLGAVLWFARNWWWVLLPLVVVYTWVVLNNLAIYRRHAGRA